MCLSGIQIAKRFTVGFFKHKSFGKTTAYNTSIHYLETRRIQRLQEQAFEVNPAIQEVNPKLTHRCPIERPHTTPFMLKSLKDL